MKILIDTVNEDMFLSLIDNNQTIVFKHYPKLKKKSDELPNGFTSLLNDSNLELKDISEIYVVNGPGSFMGIRAGMTFAKTITLATGIKLFAIDNLKYISQGKDGKYFVDAKGGKSYYAHLINGEYKISLENFKENSIIDYDFIKNNPEDILRLFHEVKDIKNYKAIYIKDPQVGGI